MQNLAVIDTNVIVAGVRSSRGASYRVLRLMFKNRIRFALSVSLAAEYEDVLYRHIAHTAFSAAEMDMFVDAIYYAADFVEAHYLWRPFLRDANDDHVLELAVAAQSKFIVTFNIRDFVGVEQFGIRAITPNDFLEEIGEL
jgi:putative PIN family toxin of toxin-antitoxin system